MGKECNTDGRHEECIYIICGKVRKNETTRKNMTYVGG
jgi:hypothetical protein